MKTSDFSLCVSSLSSKTKLFVMGTSISKEKTKENLKTYDQIDNPNLEKWLQSYSFSGFNTKRPGHLSTVVPWFEGMGWKEKWPLHYAAMLGDSGRIISLLNLGRDPEEEMTDWYNSHPLGTVEFFSFSTLEICYCLNCMVIFPAS